MLLFRSRVHRHRRALTVAGVILACGVIIPACQEPTPLPHVDLSIAKTGVVTGQTIAYTITVTNVTSVPATGSLVVSDTLGAAPAGTQFTGAAGASCSAGTTIITCTSPALAAGGSLAITLSLAVPSGESGAVTNCAYVPADSVLTNNTSCVTNTIVPPPGTISIVKDAQPDDPQDFTFTSNQSGIAPFPLDDDADPTLSNIKTFTGLAAGTYIFTETAVAGWTLAAINCTAGSNFITNLTTGAATIVLTPGETVDCTWTNTKNPPPTGSITIVKDAQPDDPQDFAFTSTNSSIAGFSLDDDADPTLSNTKTFTGLAAGNYAFSETHVSGWTLASVVCTPSGSATTDASGLTTIVLADGANVTCTWTNTKNPPPSGSITIVKDAQPDDPQDFAFTSTNSSIAGFSLDDDADPTLSNTKTFTGLAAGSYAFSETHVSGWTLASVVCTPNGSATTDASGLTTIVLADGANVTCTWTNTKNPPPSGSITIVKDAQPDDPQDFAFTSTNSSIAGFSLDDDADPTLSNTKTFTGLAAGSYAFSETHVSGWTLASVVCTPNGSATTDASGLTTIVLANGANVTCTWTNTKNPPTTGSITIVKDAQPDDPQDFAFTTNNSGIPGFSLDDDNDPTLSNTKTFANLAPGSYQFTETHVTGWTLAGIVCTPSGSATTDVAGVTTITIAAGDNVTCTWTNTKNPTTGSITIVKDAQPDDPQDFAFTTNNPGIPGFSLDDDNDPTLSNTKTFANLAPGSYQFTETHVAGWTLAGIVCTPSGSATTDVAGVTTITIAGDNVTCTWTNTKNPLSLSSLTAAGLESSHLIKEFSRLRSRGATRQ